MANIDSQENADYIIDRLLTKGDLSSWKWLSDTYETDQVKQRVIESRQLSNKDAVFYSTIYDIPLETLRCMHKE